ncbi:MAG: hypothetical protein P9X24_10365 [Candidatus Hatepunaea meridiana]|nr:hypothetical protein [Candidatus Hatepunaea meridiana]
MLTTVKKDAILFTNGDNDTYYAWDLQHRKGFRKDVTVINLNLLNLPKFIKLLRNKVPFGPKMTDEYIDNSLGSNIEALAERRWEEKRRVSISGPTDDSPDLTWDVPATNSYQTGDGNSKEYYIRVQELMILDIISANNWKRPIYFAITCSDQNLLGLRNLQDTDKNFLTMEGYAFRLMSEPTPWTATDLLAQNLIYKFKYRNLNDPGCRLGKWTMKLISNCRMGFLQLAHNYLNEAEQTDDNNLSGVELSLSERTERFNELPLRVKGLTTLDLMKDRIPQSIVPINIERITEYINQLRLQLKP